MLQKRSRDFIEIPTFCRIWYCYIKEKIFWGWLVNLNLQKKIYFALLKKKNLSRRNYTRKCQNYTHAETKHMFTVIYTETIPPTIQKMIRNTNLLQHCFYNCEIRMCWAAGKHVWMSSCYTLVGRACGRMWRKFNFVVYCETKG